jgi:anaerobic selenocysteine-containing dehydrogenase
VAARPGTDAAWALAAAPVIVAEGLNDAAYVAEQTDLPLLVRTDIGRFVRDLVLGVPLQRLVDQPELTAARPVG